MSSKNKFYLSNPNLSSTKVKQRLEKELENFYKTTPSKFDEEQVCQE